MPVGGQWQDLTEPDAGLVDDGAPRGAIVRCLPTQVHVEERSGGPKTFTVPDEAGDGSRWEPTAALRLVWQTSDWVGGRHGRVRGNTDSDNQGFCAVSGIECSHGLAEQQRSWGRVWALLEPMITP